MKELALLLTAACGLTALIGLGACARQPIHVHNANTPPGLVVNGSGEAKGVPDIARLSVGVQIRHADAQQASDQVARQTAAVIAALKQAGVADSDIQTENLSMYQEHVPQPRQLSEGEPKPAPAMFRVSNTVRVVIRDLDRASAVVDAARRAGANQMHGMQFELSDPKALTAQARAAAVADAKANASQLAQLLGVKLGPVIAVRDSGQGGVGRPMMARAEMAADTSMPVERGEMTVNHSVELVYALP